MIKFYSTWTPCLITGGVEVVSRRDQEIKYVNGLMEGGMELAWNLLLGKGN